MASTTNVNLSKKSPELVWFTGDFTSSKFKTTGYEDKTVVVLGHLTLPKGSTFQVANLVVLGGKVSATGVTIKVIGGLYNGGTLELSQSTCSAKHLANGLEAAEIEAINKLGIVAQLTASNQISLQNAPSKEDT